MMLQLAVCMLHTPVHSVDGIWTEFSFLKQLVPTVTPLCYKANILFMLEYFSRPIGTYQCMYGRVILKCYENKHVHIGLFVCSVHASKERAGSWVFWKSVVLGPTQFPVW